MHAIPTVDGLQTPSDADVAYMEYLDDHASLPGGHSFGLLLFKGDPVAFRLGLNEWHLSEASDRRVAERGGYYVGHDISGWYVAHARERHKEERGSVGFDGRKHFEDQDDAWAVAAKRARRVRP